MVITATAVHLGGYWCNYLVEFLLLFLKLLSSGSSGVRVEPRLSFLDSIEELG
jgi:hypothetical protein